MKNARSLGLVVGVLLGACGDEGAKTPTRPLLFTMSTLPSEELATAATRVLGRGADEPRCNLCHALTRPTLREWMDISGESCFELLAPEDSTEIRVPETTEAARSFLDCLKTAAGGRYSARALGFVSSAARLPFFEETFKLAYGAEYQTEYDAFLLHAAMPRSGVTPLTQEEFDLVASWYLVGMPEFDVLFPPTSTGMSCSPSITSGVSQHVTSMQTDGWRARNAAQTITMFGCGNGQSGSACLSSYPRAITLDYAMTWEVLAGSQIRVLYTYDTASSFWTRSSADGRYVSHGGGSSGKGVSSSIIDLAGPRIITTSGLYDPSFLPDNSGFAMQDVGLGLGLGICPQTMLASPSLRHVNFTEPGCSGIRGVALYQHVGTVFGGDSFAIAGQFVSDDGPAQEIVTGVDAAFDDTALITLTPFVHNGSGYATKTEISLDAPHEGDLVISPSGRLIASRLSADGTTQSGLRIRRIDAVPSGESYTVTIPTIAEYCITTTKVAFSYDERFIVYHRYVTDADAVDLGYASANDPEFAAYKESGAANVFLLDLLDGSVHRVTRMNAGQYALFPHFRSDGIIYFIVKGSGAGAQERVVATDAALVLAATP